MRSKLPNAEKFEEWVVGEVLPAIRKTGGYVQENKPSYLIEDKIARAKRWIEEQEKALELEKTILIQAPKVEYHDKVLNSSFLLSITEVAKDLGMSAVKLNKTLNEKGIIYKKGKTWCLYHKLENMVPEYFDYHITEYGQLLKVTEKGRQWIFNLLEQE
jgi:anti-repressor protein